MNTEELKKLAESVINADNSGDAIEASIEFMKAAGPQEFLALIEQHEAVNSELLATRDDNHSMMLEINGLRKARDELLAAWKEYQNADFLVSCQRGVVGKCMCARCTNDRASAVFSKAEAQS